MKNKQLLRLLPAWLAGIDLASAIGASEAIAYHLLRLLLGGCVVETEVRCRYRIIFYGLYHHQKQLLGA